MALRGRILPENVREGDPAAMRAAGRIARAVISHQGYHVPGGDLEDLVQDSLIHLHRAVSAPGFKPTAGIEALVRTIAHRRAVDWFRKQKFPEEELQDQATSAPSPEEDCIADERYTVIRQAFLTLGYACRRIIDLRITEGLSYRTVAERMHSTEGSIRVRMHRCLKKLRCQVDAMERANSTNGSRER